jgi:hypothetical protein
MATLKTRLILRNDVTAKWADVVLLKGEAGVEWYQGTGDSNGNQTKDTNETAAKPKIKIGDGFTAWSALPYIQEGFISTEVGTSGEGNTVVDASVAYNATTGIYSITLTKANRVVDISATDDDVVVLTVPTKNWSTGHTIDAKHAKQGPSGKAASSTANSGTATPSADKVINIAKLDVNEYGHVTGLANQTVTIKAHDVAVTQAGSTSGNAGIKVEKDTANHTIKVTTGDVVGSIEVADDNVVNLEVDNTTNPQKPKITGSHALKGPSTTTNTTKGPTADVTISGSGASGSIKVPKVTVDKYGHTTGLTEQTLSITMPTLPTLSVTDTETGNVVTDVEVNNHAITLKRGLDVYSKTEVDNKIAAATNAAVVMKGTVGTNGTVTTLPAASYDTLGDAYKVITAGTYASQAAKVGDLFICYESAKDTYGWILIPAGDSDTDTWRAIKVNGTQKIAGGTSTGAVDFIDGNGIDISFESGNKIKFTANISEIIQSKAFEYTAGTGLTRVDNADGSHTFNHSNSVTAGTASGTNNATAQALGATITLPTVTYDTEGHITSTGTTSFVLPNASEVQKGVNTFGKIKVGSNTAVADTYNDTLTVSGDTWIIPAVTASTDTLSFTHKAGVAFTGTTAAKNLTWSDTSFVVPLITTDAGGHITAASDITINVPNAVVSNATNGLAPMITRANSFLVSKNGTSSVWEQVLIIDGGSATTSATEWGTIS